MVNRSVVLQSRPSGPLSPGNFSVVDQELPDISEGQILVKNAFASLDPGVRKLLGEPDGYIEPIPIGGVLCAPAVGRVVASKDPNYKEGDIVVGTSFLQEYAAFTPGPMTWKIDSNSKVPLSNHLSALGATGMTAYFGLLEVGQPQPGETVLVSAASGAVGSIVGQIAKIKGCKVVGIAGGAEKCKRLTNEFGFDASIDYRGKSLPELVSAIRSAAPDGIDVFFDNVGGFQLDAALDCMNWKGRIPVCGLVSEYNLEGPPPALTNLFKIVGKVLRIEGFLVFTFSDRIPQALSEMEGWINSGQIAFREEICDGIEAAVPTFLKLFDSSNSGKTMVRL